MNHENEFDQQQTEQHEEQMEAHELVHEHPEESHEPAATEKKREPQDNAGSLFKNDRKTKESHPDITGSAMIAGQEFYVSGWRKSGQKGDFYSLSFRPKQTEAKELI